MSGRTGVSVPDVDVVMIAYNKARYIDEAIAGVMAQKGDFRLRLIVMDDCSTDATPEIIDRWRRRFPDKILNVRNPRNLGLQGNYVAGFRLVTARYMAICDADDYWCSSRKLSRQIAYMESHPECALTFHRVINYYESTGEKSLSHRQRPSDGDIGQLSRCNFITNLSVVYRRELVDLTALPDWILTDRSPDYVMHMLYAAHGMIHFFNRPMGVYRKTEGSSWSLTERFEQLKMAFVARRNLLEHFGDGHPAAEGLCDSARSLLEAMRGCCGSAERQAYVDREASDLGIVLAEYVVADTGSRSGMRRPILSRIRGLVSRLLPRPRPPRLA